MFNYIKNFKYLIKENYFFKSILIINKDEGEGTELVKTEEDSCPGYYIKAFQAINEIFSQQEILVKLRDLEN